MRVKPSTLKGTLLVPPSKSQSHRAIIFGAMANGCTKIQNLLLSSDTEKMMEAWKLLGARIRSDEDQTEIEGIGGNIDGAEDVIHAGNSGIALRFLTALSALSPTPIVITGDHTIRNHRSMKEMIEALAQLKVNISSTKGNGSPPLIIQGPIQGSETQVFGQDSQHVSGLLMLSMYAEHPIRIHVKEPGERPWVDLTLSWLDRLGVKYQRKEYDFYEVIGKRSHESFSYTVPGDFSSAAFPMAAAIITNSEITLDGLDFNDPQGDKKLISLFQQMGANLEISHSEKRLHVKNGRELKGIDADLNDCVDAVTALAVVACFAKGKTRITNVQTAKGKECNRIACITRELQKMGAKITPTQDGLIIEESSLKGAIVDSYQDHRMAMSLAVAGLAAKGTTTITDIDCIAKTYPSFFADLTEIGANFEG